jgi:hypothetical protein
VKPIEISAVLARLRLADAHLLAAGELPADETRRHMNAAREQIARVESALVEARDQGASAGAPGMLAEMRPPFGPGRA